MSFLRRIFSPTWRRAAAAEAAGDYAVAARLFAEAGDLERAAALHLLRAEQASERPARVAALRDALHFAPAGGATRARAAAALARALVARADAEGVATADDRAALAEAAELFAAAGDAAAAGAVWERLGDDEAAARAYERGGLLEPMERALGRDERRDRQARRLRAAFEEYELHLSGGDRESALAAIRQCVVLAGDAAGEHRRLEADLVRRRLAAGRVLLRRRPDGLPAVVVGRERAVVGRQEGVDLLLRAACVSREHAAFTAGAAPTVSDLGSRHGTLLGGLPIAAAVPLAAAGVLGLGADLDLRFRVDGERLHLEVARGLDQGARLLVGPATARFDLAPLVGLAAELRFEGGRPILRSDEPLRLSGTRVVGPIQLLREDVVALGDVEVEIS